MEGTDYPPAPPAKDERRPGHLQQHRGIDASGSKARPSGDADRLELERKVAALWKAHEETLLFHNILHERIGQIENTVVLLRKDYSRYCVAKAEALSKPKVNKQTE